MKSTRQTRRRLMGFGRALEYFGQPGYRTVARAINASGQVAATAYGQRGSKRAFIYNAGGTIAELNAPDPEAYGINDKGQVTGTARKEKDNELFGLPGRHQAFIYTPGLGVMDITGPGSWSTGYVINNAGQVTGSTASGLDSPLHTFLYTPAKGSQDLGTAGGYGASSGTAINDAGQIVGDLFDAAPGARGVNAAGVTRWAHPFFFSGATGMIDLNELLPPGSGWELVEVRAINQRGEIAG